MVAAYGEKKRELCTEVPEVLKNLASFEDASLVMPGVIAIKAKPFTTYEEAAIKMNVLNEQLKDKLNSLKEVVMLVVCDDARFTAATLNNFVWVSFTRCNPSHDMYGIAPFAEHKHWGCRGPLVVDARIKPHHAPPLVKDSAVEKRVDRLFAKGGSLYGIDS